jgi:chemotaxis protein methyltransferase CheR
LELNQNELDLIIQQITAYSGIVPKDAHRTSIGRYIEQRITELSDDEKFEYSAYLSENPAEMSGLIDNATVNETYFFREEKQFSLLKTKLLRTLASDRCAPLKIWSAACSSGEELYSLLLIAKSCGISVHCTGSDISAAVLKKCRDGVYGKKSIRTADGAKYQYLLNPYKTENDTIEFPKELVSSVDIAKINLSKLSDPENLSNPFVQAVLPKNQDIIFIRNVFIYFTREMRKKVFATMADKCLSKGGYIFVSMNEVASFDSAIVPPCLKKVMDGDVFYFEKC